VGIEALALRQKALGGSCSSFWWFGLIVVFAVGCASGVRNLRQVTSTVRAVRRGFI
jgi:hypothetical protein